jgi:ribosome-binding protein aMBF1 (putative translation factor)
MPHARVYGTARSDEKIRVLFSRKLKAISYIVQGRHQEKRLPSIYAPLIAARRRQGIIRDKWAHEISLMSRVISKMERSETGNLFESAI